MRSVIVRLAYAVVLFVGSVSTLEGLGQLNTDLLRIPDARFHLIVVGIALIMACVEGYSMKGIEGLRTHTFWEKETRGASHRKRSRASGLSRLFTSRQSS